MSVKTVNDLLEIAIQHEISSQNFYQEALGKTSDPKVRHFLESLIEEEKGHERVLISIRAMEIYDGSVMIEDEMLRIAGESHTVKIPELSSEPGLDEIYEIALKRETRAYNIFKQLTEAVSDDELKTLFTNLADEEKGHHKNIDRAYHTQTGQMGYEA